MLSIVQYRSERRPYKKRRGKQIIYNEVTEEEIKEYKRRYYKQYRERNRDILSIREKKYREDNKEKYKKYGKEYRENNKQILKEKQQIKYLCVCCNCSITKQNKKKHFKTQKHINNQLLLNRG